MKLKFTHKQHKPKNASQKLEVGNRQSAQCRSMQDCPLQHCFVNKATHLILFSLTNAIFGI